MKILITGGSRGIGLSIARELHENGHELFLVGRDEERLKRAIASFSHGVTGFACDLADAKQVEDLLLSMRQQHFLPDVAVLNAASLGGTARSVTAPSPEALQNILDANVVAHYRLVRGLIEPLTKSNYPRVILIGSTAGIRADDGSLYGISKWALRSYSYFLRNELKTLGIGVTLLNPGGTFTDTRVPNETTPEGRLLLSSDIAKLIAAFLTLSPQAVVEEINIRPMQGDTY